MHYGRIITGIFRNRPNRFIAICEIDGKVEKCHVKNTGRCKEILVEGTTVILEKSANASRKTAYDLVAAYKGDLLINIDSQAPNKVFQEFIRPSGLFGENPKIFPERFRGDSRFDFYVESGGRKIFVEVKGVTLENDGVCMFPDAPTERGVKHLRGLRKCVEDGYEAYLVLVVQMGGMKEFVPNYATHREFGEEMEKAERSGVKVLVCGCDVGEDSISIAGAGIPHSYSSRIQSLSDASLGLLGGTGGIHHQDCAMRQISSEELGAHLHPPRIPDKLMRVAEIVGRQIIQGFPHPHFPYDGRIAGISLEKEDISHGCPVDDRSFPGNPPDVSDSAAFVVELDAAPMSASM